MKNKITLLNILVCLFFSIQTYASESCKLSKKSSVVYVCNKILSSEIIGRPQDKIKTAEYSIWTIGEGENKSLCVDGSHSTGPSVVPGKFIGSKDSDLPQKTQITPKMWSQKLIITSDSWRLVRTNEEEVMRLYPNYPKTYDHYNLNLNDLLLTVSNPTGIKSFASLKLSCVKSVD